MGMQQKEETKNESLQQSILMCDFCTSSSLLGPL